MTARADLDAVEDAEAALAHERAKLQSAQERAAAADAAANAATPGGLRGYDPAVLSGIRRRPNPRADARRFAAYDRAASAGRALEEQERRVRVAERRLEQAKRDAAAPCDLDGIGPGWFVRDRHGWHRVVRVNKTTVSVETPWSWTDRVPMDRIVETRHPSETTTRRDS